MFQHVNLRSFLWMVTLYVVLIIGTLGCGRDDDNWVGTWSLETIDGQRLEQLLAEDIGRAGLNASFVTNSWTFNSDGTMEAEIEIKFTGKIEGVEDSASISIKVTGTYSLLDANYTLIITSGTRVLITPEGVETDPLTGSDEDTGTWTREGSTLILFSDSDETSVFKKK